LIFFALSITGCVVCRIFCGFLETNFTFYAFFGLVIDFKGFVAGIVIFIGPFDFFGLASNLNFSIFK
jgi:hypothetical protein